MLSHNTFRTSSLPRRKLWLHDLAECLFKGNDEKSVSFTKFVSLLVPNIFFVKNIDHYKHRKCEKEDESVILMLKWFRFFVCFSCQD